MKKFIITMTLLVGLAFGSVAVSAQSNVGEQISAINQTPTVKSVSGGLELNTPDDTTCHFYIFSITGQMVKSLEVNGCTTIDLPRGCYIVKCANWSKKMVVK